MAMTIIPRLDKKNSRAQIHQIVIEGDVATVTITPTLTDDNYSPRNRDKMLKEVRAAAKRHVSWPKSQRAGRPKAARYNASKSTGNVLIIEAIGS